MILLENEYVKAFFAKKGAELKSLVTKETNIEYMWSGDPEFWGKTSPVLFPVVGALKADSYTFKEKKYTLSRHGFARDMLFSFKQISATEVLFTLKNNTETLENYPFEFDLGIRYEIRGATLTCTYEVFNPGVEPLLFSIGGHPAFAVPLNGSENYNDYYLQFNKDKELCTHRIVDNLIGEQTRLIALEGGKLLLNHDLFEEDALVVKNLKSNRISLLNSSNSHGFHFDFESFPYFGIWAAKNADFVCLEPWCGIADGINHNGQLENKEGVVSLKSKTIWKRKWEINVF
ncbi:galactose mutarotase-like enzyme [Pedobacter sp. CG_S7]|uniref:aldose 1-epimerase family protein n=1 Tax=Pedobacter sp. CG_S7 TaxID=3143930 RepID=UPI00339918FB